MRKLTQKQERFCAEYVRTGNASEAYRLVYASAEAKPETVARTAKTIIDKPKIAARIEELRAPATEAAQMSLLGHLERLRELGEAAEKAGKFEAAITAETNRGKAAGYYREKVELTGADGGPLQISDTDRAARLAGLLALAKSRMKAHETSRG